MGALKQGPCDGVLGDRQRLVSSDRRGRCEFVGAHLSAEPCESLSGVLDEPGESMWQLWVLSLHGPHTLEPVVNVADWRGSASEICTECRGT